MVTCAIAPLAWPQGHPGWLVQWYRINIIWTCHLVSSTRISVVLMFSTIYQLDMSTMCRDMPQLCRTKNHLYLPSNISDMGWRYFGDLLLLDVDSPTRGGCRYIQKYYEVCLASSCFVSMFIIVWLILNFLKCIYLNLVFKSYCWKIVY